MTDEQIITIVKEVTGISYMPMILGKKREEIVAKYLVIVLLHELHYKHKNIGIVVGLDRSSVSWALKNIDALLQIDKEFKALYFACGDRMAELEDKEENKCA